MSNTENTPTEETPEEQAAATVAVVEETPTEETPEETTEETTVETTEQETTEETPTTPSTPESEVLSALEGVRDGSTVTVDVATILAARQDLTETLRRAITLARGAAGLTRAVAEKRLAIRATIVINGHPDWAARSDAYKSLIDAAESKVWLAANVGREEKQRIDGAIRAMVDRGGVREQYILDYVRERNPDVTEDSEEFKRAVRDEYAASKLKNYPPKYASATPTDGQPSAGGGQTPAGPGAGPANPVAEFNAALSKASAASDNFSELEMIVGVHRLISQAFTKVEGAKMGEIKNLPAVRAEWAKVRSIATAVDLMLAGKEEQAVTDVAVAVLYDPAKDPRV